MRLIRGIHNLPQFDAGCVATIGNFDGVHLGHQAVLGQLAEKAALLGLPTVVITFEPQPREYFAAGISPPRLTRLREKVQALRRFSVDYVFVIQFTAQFAALPAQGFIENILVGKLRIKYLVVGDDFRFGHQRQGNFDTLVDAGKDHGFQVAKMHTFSIDDQRISSSLIREALAEGDLMLAEKCLGRPYRMSGRVARGDQRGRTIGFPTANIHLHRNAAPIGGVFAVQVYGLDREPVDGVANVGTRPTVDGTRSLLEIYLFDWNQEIYGSYVQIDFLHKIRNERQFESLEALKSQINDDVGAAKAYFSA